MGCWLVAFATFGLSRGFWLPPSTRRLGAVRAAAVSLPTKSVVAKTRDSWSTQTGPSSTIVVGGGPAGLATAIMLASRGWKKIVVVDRRAAPLEADDAAVWLDFSKNYLIGLGGRGQNALQEIGVWEEVKQFATIVVGRKDWAPGSTEGVERIFDDRPYKTHVLARDRLTSALYRVAQNYPAIEFKWSTEIESVSVDDGVRLRLADGGLMSAPFAVAADGAVRVVASKLEEVGLARVIRYIDDNERVFKSIPLKLPGSWRGDLNYSARSKDGRLNFDALPASRDNDYCGVLLLRASDPLARRDTDPADLRKLLDAELPQFSELVSDEELELVAKRPANSLPRFRYLDRSLRVADKLVFVGDAAHTVKPYFGLGASAALEDVVALKGALERSSHGGKATAAYDAQRAPEAKALVQISRSLDRPGLVGLITFIGPIILDGIFHKLAPRVFQTNTIAMLQQQTTFVAVRRRKRLDRLLQVAILGSLFAALASLLKRLCLPLVESPARGSGPFCVACAATATALFLINRRISATQRKTIVDPADLLSASSDAFSSNESFLMRLRLRQPDYSPPTTNSTSKRLP